MTTTTESNFLSTSSVLAKKITDYRISFYVTYTDKILLFYLLNVPSRIYKVHVLKKKTSVGLN